MSEKFTVGTVVCLKSGGPAMTVETACTFNTKLVDLVWHTPADELQRLRIHEDCLEAAVLIEDDEAQEDRVFAS